MESEEEFGLLLNAFLWCSSALFKYIILWIAWLFNLSTILDIGRSVTNMLQKQEQSMNWNNFFQQCIVYLHNGSNKDSPATAGIQLVY